MKKHKHDWEHIEIEGENMGKENWLWLIHKCKTCGIEADSSNKICRINTKGIESKPKGDAQ